MVQRCCNTTRWGARAAIKIRTPHGVFVFVGFWAADASKKFCYRIMFGFIVDRRIAAFRCCDRVTTTVITTTTTATATTAT